MRRGSNAARQPGVTDRVPAVIEMAALEDLGPKTRYVICNSPLGMLATAIVDQVTNKNDEIEKENEQRAAQGLPQRPYIDPKDPSVDHFLAKQILEHNFELISKDRSFADARAGLTPMTGRQSPKSLREQRRAERASRRMMR